MMMGFARCLILLAVVGASLAFSGQYVPRSFYVIDKEGHKSDVVYIRNRRDLLQQLPHLRRMQRGTTGSQQQGGGNSHASAGSFASSSAGGSGSGYGFGGGSNEFNPAAFVPDFSNFAQTLHSNIANLASRSGTPQSFASSSSTGNGAGHGSGYSNQGSAGGLGAGHGVGYNGPILFSRFGEDTGTGVQVSGSAQGPRGAFSASSSSIDGDGKIKYSVQSGKY